MKPSARIADLNAGGSDGWDVYYRAVEMRRAGIDITMLSIGDHDKVTPLPILDALYDSAKAGHTGYAAVPGTPSLRVAVAKRVADRTGVPTTSDNIMVVPGGQAGLFAAMTACADPGDQIAYLDPYYATYPGSIRSASARPVCLPTHADHGFQPREADLREGTKGCRALLINTPNNPTGAVYTPETMQMIADVARDNDLWLISDEVYDTQVWDGEHLSARALPGMEERTLIIGSMSKSHMMTGSRLGWIVAPEGMVAHLIDLATNTTYGVPGYVQDASEAALAMIDIENEISDLYRARRASALALFDGENQIRVSPSAGAMYLMLDIRATGMTGEDFANALLDTHHIAVMPGESFGTSAAGHLRVALTVQTEPLLAALKTLISFARTKLAA